MKNKIKLDPYLIPHAQLSLRQINELHVKSKVLKLMWKKIQDICITSGWENISLFLKVLGDPQGITFFKKYLFIWLRCVIVVAHGIFAESCRIFSCGMRDLVPQPGMEPRTPALGVWSLNH